MAKFTVRGHIHVTKTSEGWESGDMVTHGEIEIPDDKSYNPRAIYKAMRDQLGLTVDGSKLRIPNSPYCAGHLDIEQRSNGKPVAFLERHQEA
jgi:hypothetical protein